MIADIIHIFILCCLSLLYIIKVVSRKKEEARLEELRRKRNPARILDGSITPEKLGGW